MTFSPLGPEFKKAAIDWLLTNGTCESMSQSTGTSLAYLSVYGVDYDACDMPDFARVAINSGDTDHGATYGEAFACTVYSLDPRFTGKNSWQRGDAFEFWVGQEDIMRLMLGQMIVGVINAAESGDSAWKARAYQGEVERLNRHIEAKAEHARRPATERGSDD